MFGAPTKAAPVKRSTEAQGGPSVPVFLAPPARRTLLSPSRTAVWRQRGDTIAPASANVPAPPLPAGSNSSALCREEPFVPPVMSTLPPHAQPGLACGQTSSVAACWLRAAAIEPVATHVLATGS